ncbi:unnamed protein product, partial [Ceratitis capitata]
ISSSNIYAVDVHQLLAQYARHRPPMYGPYHTQRFRHTPTTPTVAALLPTGVKIYQLYTILLSTTRRFSLDTSLLCLCGLPNFEVCVANECEWLLFPPRASQMRS